MKDRFYNGFISGVIGGIASFIVNFGSKVLGFNTVVWTDFMGLFVTGRRPEGLIERVFFISVEFAFLGVLGVLFALIIPHISSKHLILKGAIYGISVWMTLFSLPFLLQLPEIGVFPLKTVIFNISASFVWGGAMALILKKVDSRLSN